MLAVFIRSFGHRHGSPVRAVTDVLRVRYGLTRSSKWLSHSLSPISRQNSLWQICGRNKMESEW